MNQQRASQLAAAMSDIPAPIYQRVKQAIISQIRTGAWQPHQRIPSESELVNELGVSRMTINRALRELTHEGFLLRMQGVGTFVAEVKAYTAMLEVRNIAEEIAERGHQHRSRVMILQRLKANAELAEQFDTSPGQPLFHSQIVHYENELPVQLEDRYVNPVEAPDYLQQDFSLRTPYAYLSQVAPLTAGEHIVEAFAPDNDQRDILELGPNEPCLMIRRRTWHESRIVTVARLIYPGSRYRLLGRFQSHS